MKIYFDFLKFTFIELYVFFFQFFCVSLLYIYLLSLCSSYGEPVDAKYSRPRRGGLSYLLRKLQMYTYCQYILAVPRALVHVITKSVTNVSFFFSVRLFIHVTSLA